MRWPCELSTSRALPSQCLVSRKFVMLLWRRVGGALVHYAALVIAEDPIKEHSEYKAAQREQELEAEADESMSQSSGSLLGRGDLASERDLADGLLEDAEEARFAGSASVQHAEIWALQQAEKRAHRKYQESLMQEQDTAEEEQLIRAERRSQAVHR